MPQGVISPIPIEIPDHGIAVAESIHAPDFHMTERAEPFYKVIFQVGGRCRYTEVSKDLHLEMDPGALLAVNPGVRHRLHDIEPATLLLLCIERRLMDPEPERIQVWNTLMERRHRVMQPDTRLHGILERLWRRMLVEQTRNQLGAGMSVLSDAWRILVELARLPDGEPVSSAKERVSQVSRDLELTFYDAWTLDNAAEAANLSRRRFSELFCTLTGETFLTRLTRLRIEHAARLLQNAEHSIAGAAFSSGFNDLSHFYRLFKKYKQQTPKQWKEKYAKS